MVPKSQSPRSGAHSLPCPANGAASLGPPGVEAAGPLALLGGHQSGAGNGALGSRGGPEDMLVVATGATDDALRNLWVISDECQRALALVVGNCRGSASSDLANLHAQAVADSTLRHRFSDRVAPASCCHWEHLGGTKCSRVPVAVMPAEVKQGSEKLMLLFWCREHADEIIAQVGKYGQDAKGRLQVFVDFEAQRRRQEGLVHQAVGSVQTIVQQAGAQLQVAHAQNVELQQRVGLVQNENLAATSEAVAARAQLAAMHAEGTQLHAAYQQLTADAEMSRQAAALAREQLRLKREETDRLLQQCREEQTRREQFEVYCK